MINPLIWIFFLPLYFEPRKRSISALLQPLVIVMIPCFKTHIISNMLINYIFYVDGITCSRCSESINKNLPHFLNSQSYEFNADIMTPDPKKITIRLHDSTEDYETQWTKLKNYIEENLGFTCREYDYKKEDELFLPPPNTPNNLFTKMKTAFTSHWFRGTLGCTLGLGILVICLTTSGLPLAVMASLAFFSTLFTLTLGAPSYYDAWKKMTKTGTLTMDSLFAISTLSILVVSIASLFVPWLPMMFDAGLLIYGFRHIGIAIEDTIKEKIGTAKFQDRAPKTVQKQTESGFKNIPTHQIEVGDLILVDANGIIPLDGICENDAIIYNTILTGANRPRQFIPPEKVYAGMQLADFSGPLKIRVTKNQKESYLNRVDDEIEKSSLEKAPIEIRTDKLLSYFIPLVIGLAVISGILIGVFFSPALAIQCAVSVLVSACPCTLGLIIPMVVKTGMYKASEHGMQFKSAKMLQQAEQIDTVIFDLNGTLTTGIPEIKESIYFEDHQLKNQFLAICSALEKDSNHPVGKAIYKCALQESTPQIEVKQLDNHHHSGITGRINGDFYAIGSMSLMQSHHIELPLHINQFCNLAAGDQLVYVARNTQVIGLMVVTDPLREDAKPTIEALKKMDKTIHLCTGADEETAHRYAKKLGIGHVFANCTASSIEGNERSKTAYVQELRNKGHKVAMVGDAGNDAQAIATSDLGIAVVSDGSDKLTQQAAHIIIQKGVLSQIASSFLISKQTVSNIKQNLIMSLAYNIGSILISGGLLVGLGVTLNPVIGVALMFFQACIILMNVYRFKIQPLEPLHKETDETQQEFSFTESSHAKINRQIEPLSLNKSLNNSQLTFTDVKHAPVEDNLENNLSNSAHHPLFRFSN